MMPKADTHASLQHTASAEDVSECHMSVMLRIYSHKLHSVFPPVGVLKVVMTNSYDDKTQ